MISYLFLDTKGDDSEVANPQGVKQVTDHPHGEAVGGGQIGQFHQGGHAWNDRVLNHVVEEDLLHFLADPPIRIHLHYPNK